MFKLFKNKSPQDRWRIADKKKQKLRNKRSKLNEFEVNYNKKCQKINQKIHEQNVEIAIAKNELHKPTKNTYHTKNYNSVNFNYNRKSYEAHAHAHFEKNK